MPPETPTPSPAAAVAGLVPRLLDARPEPADAGCEVALADAIERTAEALLAWHDLLATGTARPATPVPAPTDAPPSDAGALARSMHSGVLPGNPASLQLTARVLRDLAADVRAIATSAPDVPAKESAARIIDALDTLADALLTHARLLRDQAAELARYCCDDATRKARRSQVLARVTKAERALERLAVATLPG